MSCQIIQEFFQKHNGEKITLNSVDVSTINCKSENGKSTLTANDKEFSVYTNSIGGTTMTTRNADITATKCKEKKQECMVMRQSTDSEPVMLCAEKKIEGKMGSKECETVRQTIEKMHSTFKIKI